LASSSSSPFWANDLQGDLMRAAGKGRDVLQPYIICSYLHMNHISFLRFTCRVSLSAHSADSRVAFELRPSHPSHQPTKTARISTKTSSPSLLIPTHPLCIDSPTIGKRGFGHFWPTVPPLPLPPTPAAAFGPHTQEIDDASIHFTSPTSTSGLTQQRTQF
jgi:hypothetical protein